MVSFIQAHQLVVGIVSMWLIGNAVSALPTPKDSSSTLYEWFFKFMQPIGAAIPRLMAVYSPSMLNALTGQSQQTQQANTTSAAPAPPAPPAPPATPNAS